MILNFESDTSFLLLKERPDLRSFNPMVVRERKRTVTKIVDISPVKANPCQTMFLMLIV